MLFLLCISFWQGRSNSVLSIRFTIITQEMFASQVIQMLSTALNSSIAVGKRRRVLLASAPWAFILEAGKFLQQTEAQTEVLAFYNNN